MSNPVRALRLLPTVILLTLGCGRDVLGPEETDPRLRTDVSPAPDWILVQRPGFSFLLPQGFEELPLQAIDSDAATYARATSSLYHDYGFYTGPWSNEGQVDGIPIRDIVRQWVLIGGRVAELVAFRYGEISVVRAWWGDVAGSQGQSLHLLMRVETDDEHVRAGLLASIYSVRFPAGRHEQT